MFNKRVSMILLLGMALVEFSQLPAWADKYFDEGVQHFQKKDYKKAVAYLEKSISEVPWESKSYYYCALAYHYSKQYQKASAKYVEIIDRFPGTAAAQNATAALKVIDPNYFARAAKAKATSSGGGTAAAVQAQGEADAGSVEGNQCRIYFSKSGKDMLVDIRVNGRGIKAAFDPLVEDTVFSRGQLQALGVQAQAGAKEQRVELQIGQMMRRNFPIKIDDAAASQPRVGQSYLSAFTYQVDSAGSWIDLQRKGAGGGGSGRTSGSDVAFTRSGKDVLVNVDINGRNAVMIFDPSFDGVSIPQKVARSMGLQVEEAEEVKPLPSEGPQRGEPGWVSPEDRPSGPKQLVVRRIKFGPAEKSNVLVQIIESGSKQGKIGSDFVGDWRCDVDYQSNVIHFHRR